MTPSPPEAPLEERLERARLAKPDRIGAGHWQEWVAYATTLDLALDDVEVELRELQEALREAQDALPDYAHPSLDAIRLDQVARASVIIAKALGEFK